MITKNRCVLLVTGSYTDEELRKKFDYEGLKIVSQVEEIEETWHHNKTPVMQRVDILESYPILEVPEFISDQSLVAFCHENGIECGEYVGCKRQFVSSKADCFLCEIAEEIGKGNGATIAFNKSCAINDVILYESKNFLVKIEYGCLVRGMTMICPKEHIMSAANIPDQQMSEYEVVKKDIEFILMSTYGAGPVIFFEHGTAANGISSHARSVTHAHTHVAWGVKFPRQYLDMVCLTAVENIKEGQNSKYLSYQEGSCGTLLMCSDPEVYIPRQYPRQVIGELVGLQNEKTNWRTTPFFENIYGTFQDVYIFLMENKAILPERIKRATAAFVEGYAMRKDR